MKIFLFLMSIMVFFVGCGQPANILSNTYDDSISVTFTCQPFDWYSGGFPLFEVTITSTDGVNTFTGKQFWQSTTGHGILLGRPTEERTLTLEAKLSENDVTLSGFRDLYNTKQDLIISNSWNKHDLLKFESKLFLSEYRNTHGGCEAGAIHLIRGSPSNF